MMVTPSGRFETERRLCLSMSDFHPESWNPMWSLSTILTGLLSFMLEDAETTGSIKTSEEEKRALAEASLDWNLRHPAIPKMFPSLCKLADDKAASAPSSLVPQSSTSVPVPTDPCNEAAAPGLEVEQESEDGRAGEAPAALKRVPLLPDDMAAIRAACEELRQGQPQPASSRLQRAIKRQRGRKPLGILLLCKARCLAQLGDLEGAASLAEESSSLPLPLLDGVAANDIIVITPLVIADPWLERWRMAASLKAKGNDAYRSGDFQAAKAAYREALQREPACAPLQCNLAAVEGQLGNHGAAVASAEAALKLDQDYHKARRRLADSLMALKEYGKAASMYAELVSLGDTSVKDALAACKKRAQV
eukprot:jgi/Botrbrau1/3747/Bobra.0363s0025.2